jgi:hypothetical protein
VPNGQNQLSTQLSHKFATTPGNLLYFLSKVDESMQIRLSFQLIWLEFYNSKFLQKQLPKSGIPMPHTPYGMRASSLCQQMHMLLLFSLYVITEVIVHIQMIYLMRVVHYAKVHHNLRFSVKWWSVKGIMWMGKRQIYGENHVLDLTPSKLSTFWEKLCEIIFIVFHCSYL